MHTTNYFNTFIGVADDTSALSASVPPKRATPSVAELTLEMIAEHPYMYTSDDVIFAVWADRRGVPEAQRESAREEFFSKGQPCLRSSDLGKRYGWGVHSNAEGRVAAYGMGSTEYDSLSKGVASDGTAVTVMPAMRSSRQARTHERPEPV